MPVLVALMTEAGPTYVDIATVCLISAPFESKGHHPSRTVGLIGGHKVYCLDTEFNRQALLSLLPIDAPYARLSVTLLSLRRRRAPRLRRCQMAHCDCIHCSGSVRPPTCRKCHKAQPWPRAALVAKPIPSATRQAIGAQGGAARAKNMSQADRSEASRKAALARWGKVKANG